MLLKNKLNEKNAFAVPLIDIPALQSFSLGNEEDWKRISSVIEVQSKIYGFRVDSLHSETFSLLGGMLRQNDNF